MKSVRSGDVAYALAGHAPKQHHQANDRAAKPADKPRGRRMPAAFNEACEEDRTEAEPEQCQCEDPKTGERAIVAKKLADVVWNPGEPKPYRYREDDQSTCADHGEKPDG